MYLLQTPKNALQSAPPCCHREHRDAEQTGFTDGHWVQLAVQTVLSFTGPDRQSASMECQGHLVWCIQGGSTPQKAGAQSQA